MTNSRISRLAYHFRPERNSRPILLLGAGASFRSGVPLADESVIRIARAAYAKDVLGKDESRCVLTPSDWRPYLEQQPWFIRDPERMAENFPFAVRALLRPKEMRREFLKKLIQRNSISAGYRSLARLMGKQLSWTVLTTNFDSLIVEALREHRPSFSDIVEVNRTKDDLVRFDINGRPQIIYLHGSVDYYRDKNEPGETERLDEDLVSKLRPLIGASPLIVVGYRGSENSVMKHLLGETASSYGNFPNGIFWCHRPKSQLHRNVLSLEQMLGSNFELIEIDGFDELLTQLDSELADESWYASSSSLPLQQVVESEAYESALVSDRTLDDLDADLAVASLQPYCERLRLPRVTHANYVRFFEEQGFVVNSNGELRPTTACYLLFGRDTSLRFPYSRIAFVTDSKKRTVIDGNLLTQFQRLLNLIDSPEVNPIIRVKGEVAAAEQSAYPRRAISELIVNLLVHRDYSLAQYSSVLYTPGKGLEFVSPGGLTRRFKSHVQFDDEKCFTAVRGLTDLRNRRIADFFYGLGYMDKAGSGLADVQDWMTECGGIARYRVNATGSFVHLSLLQPEQASPQQRVARKLTKSEVYVTNLLPFSLLPSRINILLLRDTELAAAPLFEEDEDPRGLPTFVKYGGSLYTFADLENYEAFATRRGDMRTLKRVSVEELLSSRNANIFTWLLHKHWELFLRKRSRFLVTEHRRRRIFFKLADGERTRITYDSRFRRGVHRDVVKRRGEGVGVFYENEALCYDAVEMFGTRAIQVRPTYVFTKSDGLTPMSPQSQTRLSTRRFRFDRNKNVDDDLTFWARYLSSGEAHMSIGGVGVTDVILSSDFCASEVPTVRREAASA